MFNNSETMEDFKLRLHGIVVHLTMLGEEVNQADHGEDAPQRTAFFKQIKIIMKTSLDVSSLILCRLDGATEGGR